MYKVKIYGAGSIGNHMAYACRKKGWDVLICDVDSMALERTKKDIYPSRYGHWDDGIRLMRVDAAANEEFDVVIIGTPPDTHIKIAVNTLKNSSPKVLLIEKPLCTPSLEGCDDLWNLANSTNTFVGVGYNHTLTKNTLLATEVLDGGLIGRPLTVNAKFREYWGGIFRAHPWLTGPRDSYLGFSERGGGASGEHSHAISIWQYFSYIVGAGRIVEVSSMLDMVDDNETKYDRICYINVKTEKGLVGNITQDVITEPSQKSLRVQGTNGLLKWYVNWDNDHDAIRYWDGKGEVNEKFIKKTRQSDFDSEMNHLEEVLIGKDIDSPISIRRGLETMLVIAATNISNRLKKTVGINYKKGFSLEAIEHE